MRKFSLFFSGQYGSTQVALEKFKSSAPKPFGAAFQTERQSLENKRGVKNEGRTKTDLRPMGQAHLFRCTSD
jgi:hypothetical protein